MQPYLCYVLASNEQDARGRGKAMAILLHLVASGQNDGEGIPMLVSGGQFRPRMAAVQQLVYHICPNGQDDTEGDHSASY